MRNNIPSRKLLLIHPFVLTYLIPCTLSSAGAISSTSLNMLTKMPAFTGRNAKRKNSFNYVALGSFPVMIWLLNTISKISMASDPYISNTVELR